MVLKPLHSHLPPSAAQLQHRRRMVLGWREDHLDRIILKGWEAAVESRQPERGLTACLGLFKHWHLKAFLRKIPSRRKTHAVKITLIHCAIWGPEYPLTYHQTG
jgi:hypothetical protein